MRGGGINPNKFCILVKKIKVMIKVVSFESFNGSIGKQIDNFLEEKQIKHGSEFKLIDIKYAMGEHSGSGYSYTSALIIYTVNV